MKKIVKLSESDLAILVNKVLKEQENSRYMFFSNLEQMKRQCEMLLEMNEDEIESILENGHDWAQDHIAEAKNNMDQVFDFIMNETKGSDENEEMVMSDQMMEGKKKTGTKLCSRGESAAKAKFDVYPSAYSSGYAVQVCKGKIKGLDGKRYCSGSYC
jgi:tRNA splicing ligase